MSILHPSIDAIERGYAAWLRPSAEPESSDEDISPEQPEPGLLESPEGQSVPQEVADAIRRHVAAQPTERAPEAGDIVVIPPPEPSQQALEPQQPIAILLDERTESGWSGWLVGSHVDYAGDRDVVLDETLIEGGADPSPIAGMVLCWDRVALPLPAEVRVVHRLTSDALDAVRALERAVETPAAAPAPGRMTLREVGDSVVVTGTPYLDDDPRAPYLRMARELARRISELQNDDQGRVRRPGRDEPER